MRIEIPLFREVQKFRTYQPTAEEKTQGRESSVTSVGVVGAINRVIASTFRQEDADIKAFLKGEDFP